MEIINNNNEIIELTSENLKIYNYYTRFLSWLERKNIKSLKIDLNKEQILNLIKNEIKSEIIDNDISILPHLKNNEVLKGGIIKYRKQKQMIEQNQLHINIQLKILGLIYSNIKYKTLIVISNNKIDSWYNAIFKYMGHDALVYHNSYNKLKLINETQLNNCNILITTYNTLLSKFKIINNYYWNRIIFDDAQQLNNQKTIKAKTVKKIDGSIKWFLINE